MSGYVSLPLKYRPQTLDDIVGQKHIVKTLRNAIRLERIGHAYLFIGPAGTGKTSLARIWSKEMNCMSDTPPCCECRICREISEGKSLDVIELNAADKRKIEDIRGALEQLRYKPTSKHKILILDECHMLTSEAWNAMLKDLEEPLEYVIFILCTTNPEKIPKTILSRVQTFQFQAVDLSDVAERLGYICDEEGFTYDEEGMDLIAEYSNGGMRTAISSLEQVATSNGDEVSVDNVIETLGLIRRDVIDGIVQAVLDKDVNTCIDFVQSVVKEAKNLDNLFAMLCDRFRSIIMDCLGGKSDAFTKVECFRVSKILLEYDKSMRFASDKTFVLMCLFDALTNLDSYDINARVAKLEQAIESGQIGSTRADMSRLNNIKQMLNAKDEQPQEQQDELVGSLLRMSKGRVVR